MSARRPRPPTDLAARARAAADRAVADPADEAGVERLVGGAGEVLHGAAVHPEHQPAEDSPIADEDALRPDPVDVAAPVAEAGSDRPWTRVTDVGPSTGGRCPGGATARWHRWRPVRARRHGRSRPHGAGMILGMVPNRMDVGGGGRRRPRLLATGCGRGGGRGTSGTGGGATTASAATVARRHHHPGDHRLRPEHRRRPTWRSTRVLKPNVDPHDYEPTPADLDAIAKADVDRARTASGWRSGSSDTITSAEPKGTIVDASRGVTHPPRTGRAARATPTSGRTRRTPRSWWPTSPSALEAADPAVPAAFDAATWPPTPPSSTPSTPTSRAQLGHAHQQEAGHQPRRLRLLRRPLRPGLRRLGDPELRQPGRAVAAGHQRPRGQDQGPGREGGVLRAALPPKTAEAIADEAGVKVVAGDDALYGDTLGPAGQRRRHLPEHGGAQHEGDRRQPPVTTASGAGPRPRSAWPRPTTATRSLEGVTARWRRAAPSP